MQNYPGVQEIARVLIWGLVGYLVSAGWLAGDLADQVVVVGLAIFNALWRYLVPPAAKPIA